MRFIKSFLPHLALAMLLGLAVLAVLDGFNPLMAFLTSDVSKIYIFLTVFLSLSVIAAQIAERRK